MAKDISAADVAAFFAAKGIAIPDAVKETLDNEKADNAFHTLAKTLPELDKEEAPAYTERVSSWQVRLFELAADMESEMKSETVNQQGRGTGQIVRRQVMLETDSGTLFVRLARPAK